MKKSYLILIAFLCFTNWVFSQANDCTNAILLCGNTPVGVTPTTAGFDEFSLPANIVPSCYNFSGPTTWFKVEIVQGGTLGFDVIPENGTDDYDFAVFGPVSNCSNLGTAIRCSSTNPQAAGVSANTGLNATETDLSEGPGPNGNGYLKELDTKNGETYYILLGQASGASGFQMNLNGTAILPQSPDFNTPQDLETCDDDGIEDGFTRFNLVSQASAITTSFPDSRVTFHETLNDANLNQNPISATTTYTNTTVNNQTIYTRISSISDPCTEITSFDLIVNPLPTYTNPDELYICDATAIANYDLAALHERIIGTSPNLVISYHRSAIEATMNLNAIQDMNVPMSGVTIYFVVRNTATNCIIFDEFDITYQNSPALTQPTPLIYCRDDHTNLTFDFTNIETEALDGLDPDDFDTYFYETNSDRTNDTNRLPLLWDTDASSKTVFFRSINSTTGCYADESLDVQVVESPDYAFEEIQYLCIDNPNPKVLSIDSGFDFYEWSTGERGATLNEIEITQTGTYSVTAYNSFGCSTTKTTEVRSSEAATITGIEITGLNYPRNEATITVTGTGAYEFAIDGGPYITNTSFTGLSRGYHSIAVRDTQGCATTISEPFLILDYPRYFTPNGDGYHDTWQLIGLDEYPGAIIRVYNRYGKLLKELGATTNGWDGTYLEKLLKPDDYWFELILPEGERVTGHFSLIN